MLGSHLVEELCRQGWMVKALARLASNREFLKDLPVQWVVGDLAEGQSWEGSLSGADVVFHTAALMQDWAPKEEFFRNNILATGNLLEAMVRQGVKRLLYVSTRSVHGMEECDHLKEEAPYRASNEYGASKIEAEKLVLEYQRQGKIQATIIRPTWIVGPRDRYSLPTVMDFLKKGKLALINQGWALQSFVYPTDVAQALLLAAQNPRSIGQIYLVDSGERKTIRDFYKVLAQEIGAPLPQKNIPYRVAYTLGWVMETMAQWKKSEKAPRLTTLRVKLLGQNHSYDISKAQKELGYKPQVGLEEAVRKAVDYFQNGRSE